jgi:hypothetical protein
VVDQVDLFFKFSFLSLHKFFFFLGRVKRKNMKKGEKAAAGDEEADED